MRKLLLSIVFFMTILTAENLKKATDSCELYNNMKHSKNTGNQKLQVGELYRVLEEKRGQYYVSVKGISVPNRWVDQNCFSQTNVVTTEPKPIVKTPQRHTESITKPKVVTSTRSHRQLLALSWQNAFCETHRYKKECNRARGAYTDTHFSLHGLWPQPRDNVYCNVSYEDKMRDKNHRWQQLPQLNLSEATRKELLQVMPGSVSALQRHEWIKHGTCSGMSAENYYQEAIAFTQQINRSKVGQFFAQNIGKSVTLQQVRFKMNESFGMGSGKKLELRCKNGLITEIWIHLGAEGETLQELIKNGKNVTSRCRSGHIDRVGF
jgi:ribonuclease T2